LQQVTNQNLSAEVTLYEPRKTLSYSILYFLTQGLLLLVALLH